MGNMGMGMGNMMGGMGGEWIRTACSRDICPLSLESDEVAGFQNQGQMGMRVSTNDSLSFAFIAALDPRIPYLAVLLASSLRDVQNANANANAMQSRPIPNAPRGPAAMRNTTGGTTPGGTGGTGMAAPMAQGGTGAQRYSTQGSARAKPY
jgi:hypothetical protein